MTKNSTALAQEVSPILEFPQPQLDNLTTYHGYTTRFFKDSKGNTIQVALNHNAGRIVHIWADAGNESIAFTARDGSGRPATLTWVSSGAKIFSQGKVRYVQYELSSEANPLEIGLFLLDSMRKERDFQYFERNLLPFDSEPFIFEELTDLIRNVERLPNKVRAQHLALLKAKNINELHSRLVPQVKTQSKSAVVVEHPTFDGKNHLSLELSIDSNEAQIDNSENKIKIHTSSGKPIRLTIKIGTDSRSLTPLHRSDIFNEDFLKFYEQAEFKNERALQFQRLDRQVKSVELLCYQEKLMAGLPNFATYFGRDMMMSGLMMEPIWAPSMLEHVIASLLKKLNPSGKVSHEESLGGQAIRENAGEYNRLIAEYFKKRSQKEQSEAETLMTQAQNIIGNLQTVKESYRMLDDDFQLPVLVAQYLTRADAPKDRKRQFLQCKLEAKEKTRLSLVLRSLINVSNLSQAYAENPIVENLVGFPKLDENRWFSGSWRDSDAGYANGRFAMDINVVWIPKALESIETIFAAFEELGISTEAITTSASEIRDTQLFEYAHNPKALSQAIKTWKAVIRCFEVKLTPQEVEQRVEAKLNWLDENEKAYWESLLKKSGINKKGIEFLALSLDEKGQPIPVANTDPATWLFLENFTDKISRNEIKYEDVIKHLRIFVTPYPVGLFLEGVGPLVANDAYTTARMWDSFQNDLYHSPRTVWGREVNLLLLGLSRQILAAFDSQGQIKDQSLVPYVQELQSILNKTLNAVESSGLKYNELWSYEIVDNDLKPARYSSTSDIQLWNLTDLSMQYLLHRVSN